MFQRFWAWVASLFGKKPQIPDTTFEIEHYEADYRKIDEINFAAIFGQRLSNIAFSDSSQDVDDAQGNHDGARAEAIREVLDWAWKRSRKIATQVMATGGRVLVPYVSNGRIQCTIVPQERLYIIDSDGERIQSAALLADATRIDYVTYYRWTGYTLENGSLVIRNKVTDEAGHAYPMAQVAAWANIPDEYAIANVEKLPFAFLKCPTDNHRPNDVYGVGITYGAESIIREIKEHLKVIAREYRLTRPMLGLDSTLWRRRNDGSADIDTVRKTVQDSDEPFIPVDGIIDDSRVPWMIYTPAIRDTAMYNRLDRLYEQLEKAVGTSRGILTSRETASATATEIRAANHDTFTMIAAIRSMWEEGMQDLADAVDLLAEHFGLTPGGARGDFSIVYDWDMSLFESSQETFQQLSELQSRGIISKAELRQWVRGGTLEEAQAAIDEIDASGENSDGLDTLIQGIGSGEE